MKVLLVHESYQQRGGEDEVFESESRLLEARGHEVREFVISNDEIGQMSPVALAARALWNRDAADRLDREIGVFGPDVAHFHNTFPLLSPTVYRAAKRMRVPVIKTHHNYRLLCVNALLLREGRVCEACVGSRLPWRGAAYGCYRGSRAASSVVAATVGLHRALGTWRDAIDVHVALTEFAREKLVAGGIPPERIVVKPNFVQPDPGVGSGNGGYALFVGRLSEEKGIRTLLEAWNRIGAALPLRIVGDGPLREIVKGAASENQGIEWLGQQSREQVDELMGKAECVVVPSACFEGLSRVLIESYASGTPVVAPSLGSFEDAVVPGETGLLFQGSDSVDLARTVLDELAMGNGFVRMRRSARAEFSRRYAVESNYVALMEIYRRAIVSSARAHDLTMETATGAELARTQ